MLIQEITRNSSNGSNTFWKTSLKPIVEFNINYYNAYFRTMDFTLT